MRLRPLAVAAIALVATAAVAAGSGQARTGRVPPQTIAAGMPPAGTVGSLTVGGGGATETPTDRLGNPVGPTVAVDPSQASPSRADLVAARGVSGSAVLTARTPRRTPQASSGCKDIDAYRYSTSFLFGTVVYRFHQTVHFCWNTAGKLTVVNTGTYVSNVDPNWVYRGVTASNGYFFTWCCGQATSGHYGFRQGHFDNCIIKYGCIGTEYPWVKIWVHGDGSWTYTTGQ